MADKTESPLWNLIENERRALVADLAEIDEAALAAPTALDDWTAKHVLAHLVMPFLVPTPRFLLEMVRRRGNLDAVNRYFADRLIQRPADDLVAALAEHADSRWAPPGTGPALPLTEIAVHGQDLRAALGLGRDVALDVRTAVLDFAGAGKDGVARRADHLRRLDAAAVSAGSY
ncbi:MAG: maleylpyruvate isomerase family mycothiol-dependent enzyme [Actinomycetota bacterium]